MVGDGFPDISGLEQHLPVELLKIGIIGLFGDQALNLQAGFVQTGHAEIGDGTGIAGRQALIRARITVKDEFRLGQEAVDLALQTLQVRNFLGRVIDIHMVGGIGIIAQNGDAFR